MRQYVGLTVEVFEKNPEMSLISWEVSNAN